MNIKKELKKELEQKDMQEIIGEVSTFVAEDACTHLLMNELCKDDAINELSTKLYDAVEDTLQNFFNSRKAVNPIIVQEDTNE